MILLRALFVFLGALLISQAFRWASKLDRGELTGATTQAASLICGFSGSVIAMLAMFG